MYINCTGKSFIESFMNDNANTVAFQVLPLPPTHSHLSSPSSTFLPSIHTHCVHKMPLKGQQFQLEMSLTTIMIRTGATKAQIRPSWIEIQQLKIKKCSTPQIREKTLCHLGLKTRLGGFISELFNFRNLFISLQTNLGQNVWTIC